MSPDGCRVGMDEAGKVVGTVTTLRYQDHFTWIGMVLVNPEWQRQGIGTQLLGEALQLIKNHETVKLDATPAGREVYLKLNFVDEYHITRMHLGLHSADKFPSSIARPAQARDFPAILRLDYEVFGADRGSVLKVNFSDAPQYAFVVEKQSQIKGFCFGRPGYNFNQIGPVVAMESDVAIQLVSAALQNCEGKPTVLDILDHSVDWVRFVSSLGFNELRPLIRMYRGSNAFPGLPEKQFAILGPEFG
jgi:predicted GNAT family acetyltransferase